MKKVNNEIPPRYIFFVLSGVCAILIILSFVIPGFATPVKSVVSYVVSPITKGMNKAGFWMIEEQENINKFRSINEENKALKKQIAELQNQNALSVQDQSELDQLRNLFDLDSQYSDYSTVGARIISKDTSNWYSTFTIDKGSSSGIKKDMNVIGDGGLVGIVYEVGDNYAMVRSIIDDESNVSAQIASTSDKCIVKGSLKLMNDGVLQVFNISKDANIQDGDMVVTSNISSKFLPGILIGYIKDIKEDSNNLTKSAYLTPVVDFAHLDIVLVIKEEKTTPEG